MKKCLLLAAMLVYTTAAINASDILPQMSGESTNATINDISVATSSASTNELGLFLTSPQRGNFYYPDYGGTNLIYYGMKYNELKQIYNFREWHGGYERYSPFWCGVASFFIPGLGQMCAGEGLRGLGQVGINIGLGVLATGCGNNGYAEAYLLLTLTKVGYGIWSIIDATRVAKVKNMYETDLRSQRSDISVDMYPSLNPIFSQSGLGVAPGMTLSVAF
jgi:hypothetical protein